MISTDTLNEESSNSPAPAPAGAPVEFEVHLSGVTFGPFTEAKIRERLAEDLLALNDRARIVGSEEWIPLKDVLEQIPVAPAPASAPEAPAEEPMTVPMAKFIPGTSVAPLEEEDSAPAEPEVEPQVEPDPSSAEEEEAPSTTDEPSAEESIQPPEAPAPPPGLSEPAPRTAPTIPHGTVLLPPTAPRSTSSFPIPRSGGMPLIRPNSARTVTKPLGGIRSQILARTSNQPLSIPQSPTARVPGRSMTAPLSLRPPPGVTPPAAPLPPQETSFPTRPPGRFPTFRPKLEDEEEEESAATGQPFAEEPETASGFPAETQPAEPGEIASPAADDSPSFPAPTLPPLPPPKPAESRPAATDDSGVNTRRRTQVIKTLPGAAIRKPSAPTDSQKVLRSATSATKAFTSPLPAPTRLPKNTEAESESPTGTSPAPRTPVNPVRRGMANASAMAATTLLSPAEKRAVPPPSEDVEETPPTTEPRRPAGGGVIPPQKTAAKPVSDTSRLAGTSVVDARRAELKAARAQQQRQMIIYAAVGFLLFVLFCAAIYHYTAAGNRAPQKPVPPVNQTVPLPEKSPTSATPTQSSKPLVAQTPAPAPAPATPSTPAAPAPPPTPPVDPKVLAHVTQGQADQAKGDVEGALGEFTQALILDPNYSQAYSFRAAANQAKGDLNSAIADTNQLLTLDPRNANGFCQRGFLKQANKDGDGALADYTRAIELDPKSYIAFYNRGMIEAEKNQPDTAIADYNQALEINPKLAGAFYNRGNAKMDKSDLDGAIADYTNALAINPKIVLASCNRALAEQNLGNLDAALADYNQALALDPNIAMAYYNRGLIKEQRNDLDGCIDDSTKAIELAPDDAQAYYNRGVALQAKGNLDAAANDLRKFGTLAPKNIYADYAHLYLWVITNKQSHKADADQELSTSVESNWNAEPAQLPSKIAGFLLDRVSESDLLALASSPDPKKDQGQHCEVWYFDGIKKMLTGNKTAAMDSFRQCLSTGQKDFCEYILAAAELQTLTAASLTASADAASHEPEKPH